MKVLKSTLALLLIFAMVLPSSTYFADEKKEVAYADAFNTERGSGMLIIYTPDMGETTSTNQYGNEVIVVDNIATKFSNGNSEIPENGFVLSGHNENSANPNAKNMGLWIKENIELGDYVYYTSNGIVTVSDVPIAGSMFYSASNTFLGKNVTRSQDSMVIYTNSGSTTGTNVYGYEAVVTDGIVTSVGGNNNKIPDGENSYVVSGHGDSGTWIKKNVRVGMQVSYTMDDKTITFDYNEKSAFDEMSMLLNDLTDYYNTATARYDFFDYTTVKTTIDKLTSDLEAVKTSYNDTKDVGALVDAFDAFVEETKQLEILMYESRPVEYRAVWIRPKDTSIEQVDKTVQELYENGINLICIETLYDNTMIMPMPDDSLFEVNPNFKDFDLLQAYIDACHKRGMELHLWMPVFHVGNMGTHNASKSVGTKKPEWLSVSNTGQSYQIHDNFLMLDPGNMEVQDFLLESYEYILKTYDVDGFQLDYIRYGAKSSQNDMGYNQNELDEFEAEYGCIPEYKPNSFYWDTWVEFRCKYITNFVGRVRNLIDTINPDILLGADVVPNYNDGINYYYQDYTTWLENGWLDILFPMSYGYGHENNTLYHLEKCGDQAFLAVGLGTFMSELNATDMQDQVTFNASVFTDGSTFFESTAYINKGVGKLLTKGVYKTKAITPYYDKLAAAKAQLTYAKDRIASIILPLGGISSEDADVLIKAIDTFTNSITEKTYDKEEYNKLIDVIDKLNLKEAAASRIKKDISTAIKAYVIAEKVTDTSDIPGVTDDETANLDDSKEKTNPFNPIIIIVALLCVIAIAVVVLKKRKEKTNKSE